MPAPILLSAALFPPIDYMALALFHADIQIEAHENYQKQSLRNRYYILGPNGVQFLQVPVKKREQGRCPVMRIEVDDALPWRKTHVKSLMTAYNKSPWFLFYRDDIENLLLKSNHSLWELCLNSIMVTALLLKKRPNIDLSTHYTFNTEHVLDLRSQFLHKPTPLIQHHYPQMQPYEQVFSVKYGFTNGLSILDLLFNAGPSALARLEHRYNQLVPYLTTL